MKTKTNLMKFRILSLAAFLFFSSFASVSAMRIQSTSVAPLKISQIRQKADTPLVVRGKIWGAAPTGEVTRILYRLIDPSFTTTWEFTEPFVQTYEGGEELDLTFEFDLSKELIHEESKFIVEFQKSTMNGAFAQTVARGDMSLVFPEEVLAKKSISSIESMKSFVDGKSLVSQIQVLNGGLDAEIFTVAQLFNISGEMIAKKKSSTMMVEEGKMQDYTIFLTAPQKSGLYRVEVQAFSGEKEITGVRKFPVAVEGDFALLSNLEILPHEYLYGGETVEVSFSGGSSLWDSSLSLRLDVKDSQKMEMFTQEMELVTDEVGRFSGETSFVAATETDQVYVVATLYRGAKELGVYEFSTPATKKLIPSQGQSPMSFTVEQASQEFEFSSSKAKMSIIVGLLVLVLLIFGFIFFVRHMRHANILVLLLTFVSLGGVVHADSVTSLYPEHGWEINPQASGEQENFKKVLFQGNVEISGFPGIFPFNEPVDVQVKFGSTEVVSTTFKTYDLTQYYFVVTVPSSLAEGNYPLELDMTWDGITLPGGNLEIELLQSGGDPLLIQVDKTPPSTSFEYISNGNILSDGEYSNVPVELNVLCDDASGCLPESASSFEVLGNFCSSGAFCMSGAVDEFVLCDSVSNCAGPVQVEIDQYDPIQPKLDDFDITKEGVSAKNKLKAFESYIFSFLNLLDPEEGTGITLDEHACSNVNAPFFVKDSVCQEKLISCALSPTRRGTLDQQDTEATCQSSDPCPPGTLVTPEGDCELQECSFHNFPFCFKMILD